MPTLIDAINNEMKYHNGDIKVTGTLYADGSSCLLFNDPNNDEPIAKATVNMAEHNQYLSPNIVAIKDYAENKGVLDTLINANIVLLIGTIQGNHDVKFNMVRIVDEEILDDIIHSLEYQDYQDGLITQH